MPELITLGIDVGTRADRVEKAAKNRNNGKRPNLLVKVLERRERKFHQEKFNRWNKAKLTKKPTLARAQMQRAGRDAPLSNEIRPKIESVN